MSMKKSRKKKSRSLWLKIRGNVHGTANRAQFWGTLRKAVRSGEYEIPEEWDVNIEWRNREGADTKSEDFATAMLESRESSRGWDKAVMRYINRQIERLPERRSVTALTAARTRRVEHEARSRAARKGWRTRRAEFRRRSAAAHKGWATRRRG